MLVDASCLWIVLPPLSSILPLILPRWPKFKFCTQPWKTCVSTERFIYYLKYILQITQSSQYWYTRGTLVWQVLEEGRLSTCKLYVYILNMCYSVDVRPPPLWLLSMPETSLLFLNFCCRPYKFFPLNSPLESLLGHRVEKWFELFAFYQFCIPSREWFLNIIRFLKRIFETTWNPHNNNMKWFFFFTHGLLGIIVG